MTETFKLFCCAKFLDYYRRKTTIDMSNCNSRRGRGPAKKKRKIIIDSKRTISAADFKAQLEDTTDILSSKRERVPVTKKEMTFLGDSGLSTFFSRPGRRISSNRLSKVYYSHLIMVAEVPNTDRKNLKPLDSDLQTPKNAPTEVTVSGNHAWLSELPQKKVHSFDYLVKGMSFNNNSNGTKKTQNLRKTTQLPEVEEHVLQEATPEEPVHYEYIKVEGGDFVEDVEEQVETMPTYAGQGNNVINVIQYDSSNPQDPIEDGTEVVQSIELAEGHEGDEENLVYTLADPSMVIKTEDGLDDNVLYLIAL